MDTKYSFRRLPYSFVPVVKLMFFRDSWISKCRNKATPSPIDSVDEPIEPFELKTLDINRRCSWRKIPSKNIREKRRAVQDADIVLRPWAGKECVPNPKRLITYNFHSNLTSLRSAFVSPAVSNWSEIPRPSRAI